MHYCYHDNYNYHQESSKRPILNSAESPHTKNQIASNSPAQLIDLSQAPMVAWPFCALPSMSPLHLLEAYAPEILLHAPWGPRALCAPALMQCQHPPELYLQVTLSLSKHGSSCGVLGSDVLRMWILISGFILTFWRTDINANKTVSVT